MYYSSGRAYCTRHRPLMQLLHSCVQARRKAGDSNSGEGAGENDTSVLAVDAATGQVREASKRRSSQQSDAVNISTGVNSSDHDVARKTKDGGAPVYALTAPRIALVVAHCREPMPWLRDVQRGLRAGARTTRADTGGALHLELYVYEKCGDVSEDAWPRLGWQHERRVYLENKGEECLAYLTYLVDLYDALPDAVLFFQSDGVLHGSGIESKVRIFTDALYSRSSQHPRSPARPPHPPASLQGPDAHADAPWSSSNHRATASGWWSDTWRSVNDHQYVAITSSEDECARMLTRNCVLGPPQLFECITHLNQRHGLSHGSAPPRAYAIYTNAQFGVTRDRVWRRPVAVYKALLAEFSGPEEQACYKLRDANKPSPHRGTCGVLEFLWHTVFGEPPILDPRRTMSGPRGDVEDVG